MRKQLAVASLMLLVTGHLGLAPASSCLQHYRDRKMPPDQVIDAIGLKPGMVIGEAGAGDGYFTFKMIERIGREGALYANDIQRSALKRMERRIKRESIGNIHTVLGEIADPLFPRNDLEMVVMVHAFHDFEKPVEWLENLKKYLKPGATVAIIDRDPAKTGDSHTWPKEKILRYTRKAGYHLKKDANFLADDLILVFSLGSDPDKPLYINN